MAKNMMNGLEGAAMDAAIKALMDEFKNDDDYDPEYDYKPDAKRYAGVIFTALAIATPDNTEVDDIITLTGSEWDTYGMQGVTVPVVGIDDDMLVCEYDGERYAVGIIKETDGNKDWTAKKVF